MSEKRKSIIFFLFEKRKMLLFDDAVVQKSASDERLEGHIKGPKWDRRALCNIFRTHFHFFLNAVFDAKTTGLCCKIASVMGRGRMTFERRCYDN